MRERLHLPAADTGPVWPLAPPAEPTLKDAFADTLPGPPAAPPAAPPPAGGGTLNTGDFAKAAEESALEGRIIDMHNETFAEIERARATKSTAEALGDDWMKEVSEIMLRVQAKWFPKGLHLD